MYLRTAITTFGTLVASVGAQAQTQVRVASHMSMTGQPIAHAQIFAEEVEKRFPGEFEFKLYPSAQLGKEAAIISQTKAGTLEIVAVGSGPLALDDKLGVFDLPWLFKDWEHAERALAGEFGEQVKQLLEEQQNVVALGVYGLDFRQVINKVHPIVEPADMKGLKIRVTGSKFRVGAFSAMGANPVPVAWSETFTALQTGAVEGAESTYAGFYEEKQYEVTKYLSKTNHVFGPTFLLASKVFFSQLTPEQQEAFRQIGRDIIPAAMQASQEISEKFMIELEKSLEFNEADVGAFAQAAQPIYDDYISSQGDDWIELIQQAGEASSSG
jgi:tripartite ATP-independent transporter DctP family solute receptor